MDSCVQGEGSQKVVSSCQLKSHEKNYFHFICVLSYMDLQYIRG